MNRKSLKIGLVVVLVLALFLMPVLADDTTAEVADRISQMIQVIQGNYYKDVTTGDLIDGAMKGMFEALDPHSTYFTKDEYQSFMSDIDGKIVGVGVQIENKDGFVTVVSPIEGSPAYKAGLKTGDQILYVDKTDISKYSVEQASSIIRGTEGTKVKLGIRREGVKDIIYFDLTREVININPVSYEIKPDNIGYIRISQFNENTADNMAKAINYLKDKGVKGTIIDLRDNPGGLLDQVVATCQMLIPKGPIVYIQEKNKTKQVYSSNLAKAPFKLVVLVNGGSASASEIMSGAVKDSGTGILVGEKTYGKGTVQNIWDGTDGSGYKITIANYLTPSGFSLDGVGLTPNVEVKYNLTDVMNSYTPLKGDKSLTLNTVSLDVLAVQERLKKLGYSIKDQDGFFSSTTKAAVLKFQKDNKLKEDAVMDPDDMKVLVSKFNERLLQDDPQLDRAMVEIKKLIK